MNENTQATLPLRNHTIHCSTFIDVIQASNSTDRQCGSHSKCNSSCNFEVKRSKVQVTKLHKAQTQKAPHTDHYTGKPQRGPHITIVTAAIINTEKS